MPVAAKVATDADTLVASARADAGERADHGQSAGHARPSTRPGSDIFVDIDTGYLTGDLLDPREPRWQRRTGVVKLTYLMAF